MSRKEAIRILKKALDSDECTKCIHQFNCGVEAPVTNCLTTHIEEALALLEAEPHREASQTGEPTEFTEKSRGRIARDLAILAAPQELISKTTTRVIAQEALEHLAEACDRIDRLTAENERLKKPASRCNCGYC